MVKHIVMFKLKNKSPETTDQLVAALKGLEGPIETLKSIEVGVDFKGSERSFDVVLTTGFDDRDGLTAYAVHPHHQPVLGLAGELCSEVKVVDYDC